MKVTLRYSILLALTASLAGMPAIAAETAQKSNKVLLDKYNYPEGYVTEVFRTEVPPNAVAPHHKHPGVESGYVLEGGGKLFINGQAPIDMRPGMTKIVKPDTEHWFENGNKKTVLISTYVVEKEKPLMTIIKHDK